MEFYRNVRVERDETIEQAQVMERAGLEELPELLPHETVPPVPTSATVHAVGDGNAGEKGEG